MSLEKLLRGLDYSLPGGRFARRWLQLLNEAGDLVDELLEGALRIGTDDTVCHQSSASLELQDPPMGLHSKLTIRSQLVKDRLARLI